MWASAGLVVTFSGLASSAGAAEPDHARASLAYATSGDTEGCPAREAFVDAVASRLGYDPFAAGAGTKVTVTLTGRGGAFQGRLTMGGVKDLTSKSCAELVDALAVAAALGLDPDAAFRPKPEPPKPEPPKPAPPPAPPKPPPAPPEPPPAPPKPAPATSEVRLYAQPFLSLGETPSPTAGISLGGSLAMRAFQGEVELGATIPSSVTIGTGGRGTASGAVTSGLGAACLRVSALAFCATGQLGFLHASSSGVDVPRTALSLHAGAGARVAVAFDLGARLFVRAALDGQVSLARSDLRIDGRSVWETSPVLGRFGVALGVRL